MIACAACDKSRSTSFENFSHRLRVSHDLLRIRLKRRMEGLSKCNGLSRDLVHMRSTLKSRKHGPIYKSREVLDRFLDGLEGVADNSFRENKATPGTAESLVRRGDHHMKAVVKGILGNATDDKSRGMRDVRHGNGSDLVRDIRNSFPIKFSRISRKPCKNHLRPLGERYFS